MVKNLTNPYLILTLTVISITLAIVAKNDIEFFCVNLVLLITILLISLRNFYRHDRVYSPRKLRTVILLTLIAFLSDFMFHFKWIPSLTQFFLVITVSIKIFVFGYEWLSMVKILAHRQKVTSNTIIMAIITYLFIGIIWSLFYFLIWHFNPYAFKVLDVREYELHPWNIAMYFSLITLTTVGYGDIIPTGKWVMVLANFEAMAGAIYLTVIVARLVSLYSNSE
jgi:hypothetical protein